MKFMPRSQISFDHLPQMLMETIADETPDYPEMQMYIRQLPDDLANVIALRYFASRTWDSIAASLHISIATATRRKEQALDILRTFMLDK